MSCRALLPLVALVLFAGCATGHLQTAKTTPTGDLDVVVGGGYISNELNEERGRGITNFPLQLNLRYGISDHLDLGVSLLMAGGLLTDLKYNFLPPSSPLAVSLKAGIGAATLDPEDPTEDWIIHLPVTALVSYRLNRVLTPYGMVGYGAYWIFRDASGTFRDLTRQEGVEFAEREGYGDGVLQVGGGLEMQLTDGFALLVEYLYLHPVVDDPGDFFSFVANHLVTVGTKF